ncbi:MAG: GGDEF domain-containing protein [Gammaproteobacteria bacterium]|nr:GGDEF domain-containing protein [Gammaproteobacteria bacterium]
MATRANEILPFPGNGKQNRVSPAARHPDTITLALALQTTLDIEAQLKILFNEIANYVSISGASFSHKELKLGHRIGDVARHSCSYNLELMNREIGTLEFSRSNRFEEDQLEIIEYLLSAALYPLNNAIEYFKALKLAQRDPLTGISNRLALDETLEREINRSQRYDLPLSMMVIDLDHFKKINDSYGHSTGDLVLKEAVNCIERALRVSDQVFRFGGEEFVVLLTDTDIESSHVVAERIRTCIKSSPIINNEMEIYFSASIGIAELGDSDTEQSLFDHADSALYQAKSEGRDRVAFWKDSFEK